MSEEYVCGAAVEWVNVTALREQLAAARAENAAIREALGWYGAMERYWVEKGQYPEAEIWRDCGARARALLADPSPAVAVFLAAKAWADELITVQPNNVLAQQYIRLGELQANYRAAKATLEGQG